MRPQPLCKPAKTRCESRRGLGRGETKSSPELQGLGFRVDADSTGSSFKLLSLEVYVNSSNLPLVDFAICGSSCSGTCLTSKGIQSPYTPYIVYSIFPYFLLYCSSLHVLSNNPYITPYV